LGKFLPVSEFRSHGKRFDVHVGDLVHCADGCLLEMINDLDEMMLERLDDFKRHNQNKLPSNIIFYRDGVSEGQFDQVIEIELPQVKAAFKKLGTAKAPYNPKLTLVICG
jgi:hypothetical protein